jgi:hypothetical protein
MTRLLVGEPLPAACDAHDLARAFGVTVNCIYNWKKDGRLRKFDLRQPMGSRRWSGARVTAFLEAERQVSHAG